MKYRWFVLGALGIGMLLPLTVARAQDAVPQTPTVWKPDAKLVRELTRQTKVDGYALQPPTGYTASEARQGGFVGHTWTGHARSSGIAPYFSLAIAAAPANGNKKMTAEQLLGNSLTVLKRGHTDWTQTMPEKGQINGLNFVRAYWTGTERQHKRKVRGVAYVAIDGTRAIAMTGQDSVPDAKTGTQPQPNVNGEDVLPADIDRLLLAEAAMQTFHRIETPKATVAPPAVPSTTE